MLKKYYNNLWKIASIQRLQGKLKESIELKLNKINKEFEQSQLAINMKKC